MITNVFSLIEKYDHTQQCPTAIFKPIKCVCLEHISQKVVQELLDLHYYPLLDYTIGDLNGRLYISFSGSFWEALAHEPLTNDSIVSVGDDEVLFLELAKRLLNTNYGLFRKVL